MCVRVCVCVCVYVNDSPPCLGDTKHMNIFSACLTHTHAHTHTLTHTPQLSAPDSSLSLKSSLSLYICLFPLRSPQAPATLGRRLSQRRANSWPALEKGAGGWGAKKKIATQPPVDLPRALKHKPPLIICLKDVWKIPLDSLS